MYVCMYVCMYDYVSMSISACGFVFAMHVGACERLQWNFMQFSNAWMAGRERGRERESEGGGINKQTDMTDSQPAKQAHRINRWRDREIESLGLGLVWVGWGGQVDFSLKAAHPSERNVDERETSDNDDHSFCRLVSASNRPCSPKT